MFNLIVIFLTVLFAQLLPQYVSSSASRQVEHSANSMTDYIYLNRIHFKNIIKNYDEQMKNYKELFEERLEKLNLHLELLIHKQIRNEDELRAFEVLSDTNRYCVQKYKSFIPRLATTKDLSTKCTYKTKTQADELLAKPKEIKDALNAYYNNNYETQLANCGKDFFPASTNYTLCVISVTSTASAYTVNNKKEFAALMKLAECFAQEKIERAVDCTFTVQNQTITAIAVSNLLIQKCITQDDFCRPCIPEHTCPNNEFYRKSFKFATKNTTIANPLYHRYSENCFMFIKKHHTDKEIPTEVTTTTTIEEDIYM